MIFQERSEVVEHVNCRKEIKVRDYDVRTYLSGSGVTQEVDMGTDE